MSRFSKRLAVACAVLLVAATGGLVWAGHGPVVPDVHGRVPGAEGPVEGCIFLSTRFGRGDWFRGPVTMDCLTLLEAAGADSIQYSVNFGDWQPAEDALITLNGEGAFWVQVRTVVEGGRAGYPAFFKVAIDQTPPQLSVQAPPAVRLTHADKLSLPFAATDDRSGVMETAVEINGEHQLGAGRALELWRLPLGEHEISLIARDRAGNVARSEQPVLLEIVADTESLIRLVELFGTRGKLDTLTSLKRDLLGYLTDVQAAQGAGEEQEAVYHLEAFAERVQEGLASGFIAADAGEVLLADAYALMSQFDDGLGSEPPPWW